MAKIRLLVVDDQTVVREGLAAILSFYPDVEVIGQAEDGQQALRLASQAQPDVILLDLVMPNMDGITTIPKIKEVAPKTKILVVTAYAENDRVYQAIKAGALGYILKDATREQLVAAIRDVAQGRASLQPSIAVKLIQEINHPSTESAYTTEPLTRRELETLRLIARGLSNQEIASELVVHERTIAKYVSSILDKLQLANRTQAALYALREGITELSEE
jgi:NarL family two-component system response regulator LiaR